ncbi:hypothetical protein [uncultured Thiohalocapsa sp.]|uniref:hypothetical protein n=1 Tax=uncultured Thiohalocapsa sp. TaxID=768990 RepID=UPI0025E5127F|nr:hypothetical protein [uncultured Thiohalocapsa sp.]
MTAHLLRIEAINLDQVLADTDQLSVIRGGGLLALHAVQLRDPAGTRPLPVRIDSDAGPLDVALESISLGASVGLYRFALPAGRAALAARVVDSVAEQLGSHYPHHNCVVDSEPLGDDPADFRKARERLIARQRLRQLRQPTPVLVAEPGPCPCAWDDLRPAAVEQPRKPGADGDARSAWLSASVHHRYAYGREQKQGFLNDTTGLDLQYTEDFETLAGRFHDRRLQHKLAVLYFDGNDFGKLQAGCHSRASLKAFDDQLRAARKLLLRRLLNHLAGNDDAFYRPPDQPDTEPRLRFELLLWGGDELLFVVPAWLGLDALFCTYRAMADWTWQDPQACAPSGKPPPPKHLTHAGALIFCDRKTPIDRMTQLARDLAEQGVKAAPHGGRDHNLFEYLILESIDFPAEPPATYFRRRYRHLSSERRPLSPLPEAAACIAELARLRDAGRIPHGPLHEGALRIARGDDCAAPADAAGALMADLERRVAAAGDDAERDLTQLTATLKRLFPQERQTDAWRWVHLAELWDYLGPRRPARAEGGA